MDQPLSAPLEIGFDYIRSLGPTLSQFMTALAGRRILGARGADGRVHAPPFEYDPVTQGRRDALVQVGPEGSVTSWSWMPRPLEGQPLAHPFAWALIRLDGADTVMLHAVDAGSVAAMRTGMRVRVRWAASTVGHIRDIACFEPLSEPEGSEGGMGRRAGPRGRAGSRTMLTAPAPQSYEHTASHEDSSLPRPLADARPRAPPPSAAADPYVPA